MNKDMVEYDERCDYEFKCGSCEKLNVIIEDLNKINKFICENCMSEHEDVYIYKTT